MKLSHVQLFPEQSAAWEALLPHLPSDLAPPDGWSPRVLQPVWLRGRLRILASAEHHGGDTWLHVSVSRDDGKLPTWANLCAVRRMFFAPSACVVQVLPPESEHFTLAEVLHLWERRTGARLVPDLRRFDPIIRAAGV